MISSKWIVFLGPPGCGKGTQSEYLIAKDKFVIITVGDILRNGQEKFVHEFGKTVGEIISSGALLPDTVVSDLVRDRLQEIESAEKKNILFDGYPRTIGQAEAFDGIIKEFNHKINLVLNFLVDRAVIAKRILGRFKCAKCGKIYNDFFAKPAIDGKCDICEGTEFVRRLDDNEESLKRRLSEYYEKTGVLVDFYSKRQLLRDIEADNKPEEVMKAIFDNLKTKC